MFKFDKTNKLTYFFFILFIFCFILHLALSFVGWRNKIIERHGFRQTQTAISAFYTVKEGFKINYITPVMGKPWSIPLEFPLYQWIAAATVLISKINLDQAGRITTLFFFYLSLIPLYFLFNRFSEDKEKTLVFLCIVLSSPFYIFWSRSFLIESLALFLSLCYLAGVCSITKKMKWGIMIMTSIAGILAGLTKITTFGIYVFIATIYFVYSSLCDNWKFANLVSIVKKKFAGLLFLFVIPLLINLFWIYIADNIRELNLMASEELNNWTVMFPWYFGTISQRFSIITWREVLHYITYAFMGSKTLLLVFAFMFLVARNYRLHTFISFLCFLSGPIIFSNLYYHHEYYYYANGMLLLAALAFITIGVMEKYKSNSFVRIITLPLLLSLMFAGYFYQYYNLQKTDLTKFNSLIEAIKTNTSQNDVIVIYGFDWSSEIPYYSERKALMDYHWLEPEKFNKALELLKDNRIGGMVVSNKRTEINPEFIAGKVQILNLLPAPVFHDEQADFYVAK